MTHLLRRLARDESAQDIIEYALVAAGIATLLIPTIPQLGGALVILYERITSDVSNYGNSSGGS